MNTTALVLAGVEVPPDAILGPFVILGEVPGGSVDPSRRTVLGPGARIRSHTVVYAGNRIGARFQTGHGVLVREDNWIGDDVSIGSGTVLEHHVQIGDRVRIHSQAFVPEYTQLEDDCWIGPNVVITNAKYPRSPGVKDNLSGVRVCRGAKIGANTTVLPGVVIGADALVGAGSVATKDVAPGAVVAGNPARLITTIDRLPYTDPSAS